MNAILERRAVTAEVVTAGACLPWLVRAKAYAAAQGGGLQQSLDEIRCPQEVALRIKSEVSATSTTPGTVGTSKILTGFLETLTEQSILARLFSDNAAQKVPLRTRLVGLNADLSAGVIGEGEAVPVSALDLSGQTVNDFKIASMAVMTDEMWRNTTPEGQAYVISKLREAVSLAADRELITRLTVSGALTQSQAIADLVGGDKTGLLALLDAVHTQAGARLHWAISPIAANALSVTGTDDRLNPFSGQILGLPATITSSLDGAQIALINGRAVGGQLGDVRVEASNAAAVEMDDDPTGSASNPTSKSLLSLFQVNCTAVKVTFTLAAEPIRDNPVAFLELTGG